MEWYIGVLKKYAVFEGRARRKEYWMFFLFNFIISFGLGFIDGMLGLANEQGSGPLGSIYSLAVLVPSIAVGIRRLHDTDRSGWWLIVPIANLVFLLTEGTRGPNRFGPDPKGPDFAYSGAVQAPVAPQPYGAQQYPSAPAPYQPAPAPVPPPAVAPSYPPAPPAPDPAVAQPAAPSYEFSAAPEPPMAEPPAPEAAPVTPPVAPTPPQIPAGWHADPTGRHQYRYWDAESWTEHVSDNGATSTDPV